MVRNIRVCTLSLASSESSPLLSNLVNRSFCCSTTQPHQEIPKEEEPNVEDKKKVAQQNHEEDEEDEEDGDDNDNVNKETGEIGGPRRMEPTRFGDWERNGWCFNF